VGLLHQAGYVEAINLSSTQGIDWRPRRLTWQGHDFLEAARNDIIWAKAKAKVVEQGVGLSVELMKAVLLSYGKERLGIS
jgi:hypothetical protein